MSKEQGERHALITGGNGGLGSALLLRLLAEGWRVTAVVRGGEERLSLHPLVVGALKTGQLRAVDLDLGDYVAEGVSRPLVEGPLDALVNIAGGSVLGSVSDVSLADYRSLHRLNVEAPYLLVQAHLPALVRGKGVIVQTSSLSAAQPLPYYGVYASTKLAVEGWSEALSHELAPLGVRVFCVQPGAFRTGVYHRMRFIAPSSLPDLLPSFRRYRSFFRHAARSMGEDPDVFARHVVRLLSGGGGGFRQRLGPGAMLVGVASWLPDRVRLPLVRAVLWVRVSWGGSDRLLATGERSEPVVRR